MQDNQIQDKQRFHHRHMPTLTHFSKKALWKFLHLYYPAWIHERTDKYKNKIHHLIMDTFYVVVTVILVAFNIGLGVWYYRYFTQPQLDVQIVSPASITSGKSLTMGVVYHNHDRRIENVTMDVYVPRGFLSGTECYYNNGQVLLFSLGDMEKLDVGLLNVRGVIYGNIGDEQTIRVVTTYTYYNQKHTEFAQYTYRITDSTLKTQMSFPQASIYDAPIDGAIDYHNEGDYAQKNIQFALDLPPHFQVDSITQGDTTLDYNNETHVAILPNIEAHASGSAVIHGRFVRSTDSGLRVIQGDQQSEIVASVSAQVDAVSQTENDRYSHGVARAAARVVTPRLVSSISGNTQVYYGDTITHTVVVRNTGDVAVERVRLFADVSALSSGAISMDQATASVYHNGRLLSSSGQANSTRLYFPEVDALGSGESRTFTVNLPTRVVDAQQLSTTLSVSGSGYSPEVDLTIPLRTLTTVTQFHSHTTIAARAVYYGPSGEELGYGPYPAEAWEPTALRIFMNIKNTNNPLTDVRIRTTLPQQMQWTGVNSVSVGTNMSWDPRTRTVEWRIPALAAQSEASGAQFEIRFTPNHLQVGKRLPYTNAFTMSAHDHFTGAQLVGSAPGLLMEESVQP